MKEEIQGNIYYIRLDVPITEEKKITKEIYLNMVLHKLKGINASWIHIHNRPEFVLAIAENSKSRILLHMHNRHFEKMSVYEWKKVVNSCEKVIFVSQYLKEKAVQFVADINQKAVVVYNGIDTQRFAPRWNCLSTRKDMRDHFGFSSQNIVLLYVGRIVPEKGLLDIIRTLRLVKRGRNRIKLMVVGASEFGSKRMNSYEERVHRDAKALGSTVVFTGYVEQEELPKYYQMADLFIAPIRWEEPFGLVICEAAACGTPIISTRKGAIPEIIEHEKEGLLLPRRFRKQDLKKWMIKLVVDQDLRRNVSRRARRKMERQFTWNHSAKRLENIYKGKVR